MTATARVLITGGNGFIGAWVARTLLAEGHALRIFDVHDERDVFHEIVGTLENEPIERLVGNIADAGDVERAVAGVEAIVHLAGILVPGCREDPLRGARVNVLGTLNVFEAAKRHGVRGLAYASTAAVFGPDDGVQPYPLTHYGAFKLCTEGCARAYWLDAQVRSVGLRPYTVYGPGRSIGITAGPTLAMRAAARGDAYTIPFTGSTGMDYVADVATAFARAATATPDGAHVFSLAGVVASTDEIIAAIREVVPNARISAQGPPLPIAPKVDEGDLRRVFTDLPRTPLAEGTRATIEFYR
ncbi:MAG: NAD(P)-dependent oxidoreductase [Candidatus Eremiobacteraeota bacterium]|nr:NAD(P)-dependent oxidoreductase [Candidatus Eremiobacteraeota bacterium]